MASTPHPSIEIGSLTASSPEESQFIGSSSGVFFVNTVHRAFARSKKGGISDRDNGGALSGRDAASVENIIAGEESPRRSLSTDGRAPNEKVQGIQALELHSHSLGMPPSQEHASSLIIVYFQTWHPLLPFLHGPSFLRDVEAFYAGALNFQNRIDRQQICRAIMFQCIFNIAALDKSELNLPDASRIESSSSLLSLVGIVAAKHDIMGLQTLIAMQLYLIATMSLRAASTVGGVLVKLLFHGGFHRCPFRYSQISQQDFEIRKRIFWCAYATDRYLSQALGHPLGMQDSDVDVCLPGMEERHQSAPPLGPTNGNGQQKARVHLPQVHPDLVQTTSDTGEQSRERSSSRRLSRNSPAGEDILANYVNYCRITGRALELFHKSLHTRSVDHRHITLLTSDVHSWWNNLPLHLQERTLNEDTVSFAAFFNILYQNLIILINRPFLSLNPSTPDFRLSLQTCAGASRKMILILRDHATTFSWPGILSGTWMAGLVLAFGCELDLYPYTKGVAEIEICLSLLQKMSNRFSTARHCHAVLSILLNDLHAQFDSDSHSCHPAPTSESFHKRRKLDTPSSTISNQPQSLAIAQVGDSNVETEGNVYQSNSMMAFKTQPPFTQSTYNSPLQDQSSMLWPDPMMSGDIGDVFGQVSWEALFQGDGAGWKEWDDFSGF